MLSRIKNIPRASKILCIYTGDDDSWLKKDDVLVVVLPNGRVESRIHWFQVPGICRAWNGNIGYGNVTVERNGGITW